jgi:type II secretory ATPase GspE/PulE/Tfp pilus assembly ATPase PilB-like protein
MSDEPVFAEEVDFEEVDLGSMPPQEAAEVVIRQAAAMGASDLYMLSEENSTTIAVRRLGQVEKLASLPKDQGGHLIRSLKAVAGLDIAETRRPLDGRFIQDIDDHRVDLRINSIPTLFGEDLTCRILDRSLNLYKISELGMSAGDESNLIAMLNSPSGLILVTGPTGTGKTTTLYASLQYLNDSARKINTLEDPIEFAMEGVRQSQVNAKLGVNFSDLLRNVLRQAPDIIMIGEIRDEETATTAVRAANSGHLVLATLHAPIAAGAVQSMLALGAHPYFLASCLLGVVAQRLIRVLNPETRMGFDISMSPDTFKDVEELLQPDEGKAIYGPDPTDENSQGGYISRTGLFEVMTLNREIRRLISEGRPSQEIEKEGIKHGMIEFRRAALLKVAQGITSAEEMLRAVPSEYLGLED